MAKNTGKVREKSGNFVSPEKWEPCINRIVFQRVKASDNLFMAWLFSAGLCSKYYKDVDP